MFSKFLLFLFFNITFIATAENIAILPVEAIRLPHGYERIIQSEFINYLNDLNHSVIAMDRLNDVIETQKYNLSGLVNDTDQQFEIGNLLAVDYIIAVTIIWNGEYYLIDVQYSNIETGKIIFGNNYISYKPFEQIVDEGIRNIVDEMFGNVSSSTFWEDVTPKPELEGSENIISWARSLKKSNIVIAYYFSNKFVDDFFTDLYNAGEYVFKINITEWIPPSTYASRDDMHFYYDIAPKKYQTNSTVPYTIPPLILKDPNTVIVCIDQDFIINDVISNLSREERRLLWPLYFEYPDEVRFGRRP